MKIKYKYTILLLLLCSILHSQKKIIFDNSMRNALVLDSIIQSNIIYKAYSDVPYNISVDSIFGYYTEVDPIMIISKLNTEKFYTVSRKSMYHKKGSYEIEFLDSVYHIFLHKYLNLNPFYAKSKTETKGNMVISSWANNFYVLLILNNEIIQLSENILLKKYNKDVDNIAMNTHLQHLDSNMKKYEPIDLQVEKYRYNLSFATDTIKVYNSDIQNNRYIRNKLVVNIDTVIESYMDSLFNVSTQSIIKDSMFMCCCNLREVKIPESIEYLGNFSFAKCVNLKNIDIPNSLKYISDFSFYYCISLTNINIPDSVSYIGEYAFFLCENLRTVSLPNTLEYIQRGTFQQCSKLCSVIIPNTVKEIKEFAFLACPSLDLIIVESISPPNVYKHSFDEINNITTYVPDESLNQYMSHKYWGKMKIKPMSELKK